jgi:hypothetical protein
MRGRWIQSQHDREPARGELYSRTGEHCEQQLWRESLTALTRELG